MPIPRTHEIAQLLENSARSCPVHHTLHPSVEKPVIFHWAGE